MVFYVFIFVNMRKYTIKNNFSTLSKVIFGIITNSLHVIDIRIFIYKRKGAFIMKEQEKLDGLPIENKGTNGIINMETTCISFVHQNVSVEALISIKPRVTIGDELTVHCGDVEVSPIKPKPSPPS